MNYYVRSLLPKSAFEYRSKNSERHKMLFKSKQIKRKELQVSFVLIAAILITLFSSCATKRYSGLDFKVAVLMQFGSWFLDDPIKEGRSYKEVRSFYDDLVPKQVSPPIKLEKITEANIPGSLGAIPLRIYTPEGNGLFPIIVFFHGGGWILGNLDTHDSLCRLLSKRSSSIVISVDYRLAPENAFPAGLNDAYQALQWASENATKLNGDSKRIVVAGDSSGGNLAAVVCLKARDENGPKIAFQVLICPSTDLSKTNTDSYKRFAEGYFPTKQQMEWFRSQYVPKRSDWTNPYVSPLLSSDLSALPPALIITAEHDVLENDGKAYAQKLIDAGVPTVYSCYTGIVHGFVAIKYFKSYSDQALDEIASMLRKTL